MKNRKKLLTCAGLVALSLACGAGRAEPAIERLPTLTVTAGPMEAATEPPILATEPATPEPVAVTPEPVEGPPTETFTPEPAAIPPTEAATATPIPPSAPPPTVAITCECSADTYNCEDPEARTCFEYCLSIGAGDIHGLDGDNDGLFCE